MTFVGLVVRHAYQHCYPWWYMVITWSLPPRISTPSTVSKVISLLGRIAWSMLHAWQSLLKTICAITILLTVEYELTTKNSQWWTKICLVATILRKPPKLLPCYQIVLVRVGGSACKVHDEEPRLQPRLMYIDSPHPKSGDDVGSSL
jgi:hypothetical protein